MASPGVTSHCPRHKGVKEPKTLCKEVLTKHKVGHFLLPPPTPPSLQRWQAASHQQRKKSHLAVLILAALCLTGGISWLDL